MSDALRPSWNRVAKNAMIMLTLKVVMPVLSMGFVLALSRFLGAEGLGQYSLVMAYFDVLMLLTPLGLETFLSREGVRDADGLPLLLGNAAILGAATTALSIGFMVLGTWNAYDEITRSALLLLSGALWPSTLMVFFESVFVARERFEYFAVCNVFELVVKLGCGLPLLILGYGIEVVILTFVGSRVLSCVLAWGILHRAGVRLQWRVDRQVLKRLLQAAPTFLGISVFTTLYWRIDVLMLSFFRDVTDVGYYGAAFRIMELVRIVPQSLCQALYPQIIQMAETAPQQLGWLGGETLRYVWVAILPMALGVMLLGGPIITWLYGDGFAPAASILTVLIWTVIPYAYVRYAAYVLLAMDRQHINLWVNIALSVVNVIFNLLLIPYCGALGAALATFFSITLSAIGKQAYLHWYLSIRIPWPSKVWTPLIAAAVMGLVVWWLRQLPVVIVVPVAACLYGGGLIIGGYFTADELRFLRLDRVFAAMGFPTG